MVAIRAKAMEETNVRNGKMMAVRIDCDAAESCILKCRKDNRDKDKHLSIAAINSQNDIVLSGSNDLIRTCVKKLGVNGKYLKTSHAFHSPLMHDAAENFNVKMD